jgi:hypothetical protein
MSDETMRIRDRLTADILDPYVKKFRTFALVGLVNWPINFIILILVFKLGSGFESDIPVGMVMAIIVAIGVIDGLVFAWMIKNLVQQAKTMFFDMFPVGTSDFAVALEALSGMNTPSTKVLMNSIVKEYGGHKDTIRELEDQGFIQVKRQEEKSPEKVESAEDGLIDLNSGEKG